MTTLVTSYLNYYKTPLENATHQLRLSRFKPLLQLKAPLCIFVTPDCVEILHQYLQNHCPQFNRYVKLVVLKTSFFESSYMFLSAMHQGAPSKLPNNRFPPKDTFDFMCYSHTKTEFLKQATEINPFRTYFFAWVDYDIANMFHEKKQTLDFLRMITLTPISNRSLPPTEHEPSKKIDPKHHVYIPGCWSPHMEPDINTIHWRFCGCFFVASIDAIQYLWSLYDTHYVEFLKTYDTMVWDINFLAWLEHHGHWKPIWYKADHNDSIIRIPPFAYSETISLFASNVYSYPYPEIDHFLPSSASIAMTTEKNKNVFVLNTRYVNYEYLPSGHCNIYDPERNVYTRNVLCFLDEKAHVITEKGFHMISEKESKMGIKKVNDQQMFHGVEDIRLFHHDNQLRFIATTVNYSDCGKNRMMFGDYNIETLCLENCKMIDPPQDTPCEKNWIPFLPKKEPGQLYFIYKWSNMYQIGKLVDHESNTHKQKLQITHQCKIKSPLFQYYEIRGSSNVLWTQRGYICMVHLSVDGTLPKQYYHMMVLLDLDTYLPKAHSKVFHFYEYGVEFCLSISANKEGYVFWISRQDRDPVSLEIPFDVLSYDYKIETSMVQE